MKVGDSVRLAIDEWMCGELEAAMLHACNAVDGTAKKRYPSEQGNNARFTRVLRENYNILGAMATPGVDLSATRWPVKVARPKAVGGDPDIADLIYGIHRCSQGHGDELPEGFELLPDAAGPNGVTTIQIEKGKVRLSDRVIFGLVAIAVMSQENVGQIVPTGYHLLYSGKPLLINDWWGRAVDFSAVVAKEQLPAVKLEFGDWMDAAK